jgi:hypothetical protein
MKTSIITLLTLAAACQLLTGCCTHPSPSAWEYRDVLLTQTESLNDLAKDGWVVVSTYYDPENKDAHFVVKRLKK